MRRQAPASCLRFTIRSRARARGNSALRWSACAAICRRRRRSCLAARRGAQVVFHPHFHESQPGDYQPASFGDPANSFHEKAMLCRAAENNCYFTSVNYASAGSPTTSAVVRPDGTLLSYQPYSKQGLLIADLDLTAATGLLAARCNYG